MDERGVGVPGAVHFPLFILMPALDKVRSSKDHFIVCL